MDAWSATVLALALSIDGLAVGVAYGMRGIRVPFRSLAIIGFGTALCFSAALFLGDFVAGLIGTGAPHIIGASILIGLGLWHIGKSRREQARDREGTAPSTSFGLLVRFRIRALGIVVQVLREPGAADVDRSGAIESHEALVLGIALGLDAFAAGFGAAFIGFGFSFVVIVAAAQLLLTWLGLYVGRKYGVGRFGRKADYVPGIILMVLGLLQL